jgi:hypothetical protein
MDNHEACQSPRADGSARSGQKWGPARRPDLRRHWRKSALFRVWHGSCEASGNRDQSCRGENIMASKLETLAFAVGFIATGFLTFVALPLA